MGEDTLGRAERKGSGIQEMQCEKLGNIEQKPVKVIGGGEKVLCSLFMAHQRGFSGYG